MTQPPTPQDELPEDLKQHLGSAIAHGTYMDEEAREKEFEEISAAILAFAQKYADNKLPETRELLEIQSRTGNWDYDPYMHGMYNGMEVILAVIENREPELRSAPKHWLSDTNPRKPVIPESDDQAAGIDHE